ncbi:MAG TPA: MlaD family protein [Bradyrhizobium sp.]|nr:MlaD family protein [Bradyrhizobium sp.]
MRATNLVIGTTMLAVIGAAFAGLLVYQKIHGARNQGALRIVFNGSASGLRRGGAVTFDGVPAGVIRSIKLENPRKIVAEVLLDNSAPLRKDTAVGIEFQGLTGVAAIALVGGAPSAPPVPLDHDGTPLLTADWSEQQSITDTLHIVDNFLLGNRQTIKDSMLSFETYTASLKSKGEAVDDILARVDDSFAGFDSTMARINNAIPGFADGKADELFEKLKSLRELADTYKQKSDTFLEEGRRMLSDVSEGANNFARKIDPQSTPAAAPPRRAAPKRQ